MTRMAKPGLNILIYIRETYLTFSAHVLEIALLLDSRTSSFPGTFLQ
ncbi:hypothetical protein HG541_09995 [Proteus terrae subsp. cibarius]|nr:hypothetical protein [Proteus terrae]QKD69693.1 hypothetical protein HG541_09995 [Proteus terrae subsp. cibarius]